MSYRGHQHSATAAVFQIKLEVLEVAIPWISGKRMNADTQYPLTVDTTQDLLRELNQ